VTTVTSQATASRRLKPSALQRISEVVLIAGTVGAVAAASGPLWMVRIGDLNAARHAHAQAMLQAAREHGARMSEERGRNAAVVDALSMRIADAGKVIERQRTRLAQQRLEMSSLNEERAYLRGEIDYRDKAITALRETVPNQEAELITSSDQSEAEVHHMPRRILVGHDFVWQELSADDELVVLPNYEADRQPA
jgi:predicted nuclease with TOPRIM domain